MNDFKLPVDYTKLNWKKGEAKKVRELYIKQQNNLCYYCNHSLDNDPPNHIKNKSINKDLFPQSFFNYPIHLDHDHKTNMTRGAVHAQCNAVMWQYEGR